MKINNFRFFFLFILLCMPAKNTCFSQDDIIKYAGLAAIGLGSYFAVKKIYSYWKAQKPLSREATPKAKHVEPDPIREEAESNPFAILDALQQSSYDKARLLINAGADVNAIKYGTTPLILSIAKGLDTISKALIEKDADVCALTHDGYSPLHAACNFSHDARMLPIIKLLVEKGADINLPAKHDGWTPLHFAAKRDQGTKTLIQLGAQVNVADYYGWTPLHFAAEKGYCLSAGLLIKHGAIINARTKAGLTPLHQAARFNWNNVMKLLIENGADIDAQDESGNTPLHRATRESTTREGNTNALKILLSAGARIDLKNAEGYTPVHLAANNGKRRFFSQENSIVEAFLCEPLSNKQVNANTFFMNSDGSMQITPLSTTCWTTLLKEHSEEELKQVTKNYVLDAFPQDIAQCVDLDLHKKLLDILPAEYSDMNSQHIIDGCRLRHLKQIKLLLGVKDNSNNTPIDLAHINGHDEIAEKLQRIIDATSFEQLPPDIRFNIQSALRL